MKPKVVKIYSENNDFQHIEVLKRNREKRSKFKEFFVEGVASINQAINNNWGIKAFIYQQEKELSDWAKHILKNSKAEKHYELSENLLEKLSDKEESSELIAIIRIPADDFRRIKIKNSFVIVIFDRPVSPGNLGTVIRSCEAFNVNGLIITGHAVDLYDPKTVRSSVGAIFSLPVLRVPSHKDILPFFESLKKLGDFQIIGTSAKANKLVYDQNFIKSTFLIIGNETYGLSNSYKNLCNEIVKIPIQGSVSSLNVATATSISLYEIYKQRKNK